MTFNSWEGLYPALWTPAGPDGSLLRAELAAQVRFLRRGGADGVMALGSTGDFVHLDMAQRQEVLQIVVDAEPGWPLIANCSDISPRRVAEIGRIAKRVGAAAISLLPPWFYASAPEDIVEFMVRGAEAADLPLLIYNFPERTGQRLSLETVAAVCDRVKVVGLKQSGAEFAYHRELAQLGREKGFTLITGADTRIDEAFALGARGVVSGLANALPEWIAGSLKATVTGDAERAAHFAKLLDEFAVTFRGLEFPLDMGVAMEARGRVAGTPKALLSEKTRARMAQAILDGRKILAREHLGAEADPSVIG